MKKNEIVLSDYKNILMGFIKRPFVLFFCLLVFFLASCDSTYEYNELRIVLLDKIGDLQEGDIPDSTLARLNFFHFHAGDSVDFIPENIFLVRLDPPYDIMNQFGDSRSGSNLFKRKSSVKFSDRRKEMMKKDLLTSNSIFEPSVIGDSVKYEILKNYIGEHAHSHIFFFKENLTDLDSSYDNFTVPIYNDTTVIYNEIEKLLLKRTENKIEYLEQLSVVIVMLPEKVIIPDTIFITNDELFKSISRTCRRDDLSFYFSFGPFDASETPDSLVWEAIGISDGFNVVPARGTSDITTVKVSTTENNLTGRIKILAMPYKDEMISRSAEFIYDFKVTIRPEPIIIINPDNEAEPVESIAPNLPVKSTPTPPVESTPTPPVESTPTPPVESTPTPPADTTPTVDPCPPKYVIHERNQVRLNNIEEFKELVYQIWTSTDTILLDRWRGQAGALINRLDNFTIDYQKPGDKLYRFLDDLVKKEFSVIPQVVPFEDNCGIISGIRID